MSEINTYENLLDEIESLEIIIKKHKEAIRYILAITKDYNNRHNDNLPISCMCAIIESEIDKIYE